MQSTLAKFIHVVGAFIFVGLLTGVNCPVSADSGKMETTDAFTMVWNQDLAAFVRLRANLAQLTAEVKRREDLFGPKPKADASLLRPEIRRQIFSLWYPMVDNYLALDALARKYMDFPQLADKKERNQAFHLAHGVFLTQYRFALEIIAVLEQNPRVDTILNEADVSMGLIQGVYSQFKYQYLNVVKAGRYAAMEAVARVYDAPEDDRLQQWADKDSQVIFKAGQGPGPLMTFKNGMAMIKRLGHAAWFPLQKGVAGWMGQTKVWRAHRYLIQAGQIKTLSERLEPGDILLERREWYLTNVGIPGFWTHAALFIGGPVEREKFSQDPDVKKWLGQQKAETLDDLIRQRYPNAYEGLQNLCKDGLPAQVIEALSPGVFFTSLRYSATCDSVAVLRPRLPKADRAAAVVRAMLYYGRPYDYDFDFVSDASLVCTELIVKSYLSGEAKQGLKLPLEDVMGQLVTPANAFARQFDQRFGAADRQMDLVVFLDGDEKNQRAVESTETAFRQTWRRPKWHILIQPSEAEQQ